MVLARTKCHSCDRPLDRTASGKRRTAGMRCFVDEALRRHARQKFVVMPTPQACDHLTGLASVGERPPRTSTPARIPGVAIFGSRLTVDLALVSSADVLAAPIR